MDMEKREDDFEKNRKLNKNLKEAYRGMMLGLQSAPKVGDIATRHDAGAKNAKKLANRQGVRAS